MASPNPSTGIIPQGSVRIVLSRGGGSSKEVYAVNGARNLKITRGFDSTDYDIGETMTKGKILTGSQIKVEFTAGGWSSDLSAFLNGFATSTAGATIYEAEAISVVAGAGTLPAAPLDDDAVIVADAAGTYLDWVDSSPGVGEFSVSGTSLTISGTPTATYYVDYSGVSATGLKSTATASLPCEVNMFAWSPAAAPGGTCETGTSQTGIAYIVNNMVIDGDLVLADVKKDNDGSNDFSFVANLRNPATDYQAWEIAI